MLATALLGADVVGMQAFEWSKPDRRCSAGESWGAAQFGLGFFMITGFHGTHVTIGVDLSHHHGPQGLGAISTLRSARAFFTEPEGKLRDR
jgi:hypothetical protein